VSGAHLYDELLVGGLTVHRRYYWRSMEVGC